MKFLHEDTFSLCTEIPATSIPAHKKSAREEKPCYECKVSLPQLICYMYVTQFPRTRENIPLSQAAWFVTNLCATAALIIGCVTMPCRILPIFTHTGDILPKTWAGPHGQCQWSNGHRATGKKGKKGAHRPQALCVRSHLNGRHIF